MATNNVYQIVTDRIIAKLEAGTVPWKKPWTGGESAKNLCSQKAYRGINAILTNMSGYRSPYWLTYKQAADLGANVKAGEKGTPIIFFSLLKRESKKTAGKIDAIPMMRYFTVFNVEQCENLRLKPELLFPSKVIDFKPIERCESIVKGMPNRPAQTQDEQRAYYRPSTDVINMPAPETFESPEFYYQTLFHELTHSTGHPSRLAREGITMLNGFGSHSYSKEELVAEMGAAFLCSTAGIDPEGKLVDNSAAYIRSWLKVLKSDPKFVVQAAALAQKATDLILNVQPATDEKPEDAAPAVASTEVGAAVA